MNPWLPVDSLFFLLIRSWMRLQSTGSKSISYLMPTLTRTRNSRSRPESWRCVWGTQLMSNVTTSASLETDAILLLFILASVFHVLNTFICYLSSFTLCSPLAIHWTICFLSRRVFPLLWLAPTNWLRLKERRSVVVCTHGEWLKWRTQSTMTSLNYAPCLCESTGD